MKTAMSKIARAAPARMERGEGARAFGDGAPLDGSAFSNLLRISFGLRFTPAELGALVVLFDRDGDGAIDSGEFGAMWRKLGHAQHCAGAPAARGGSRARARGQGALARRGAPAQAPPAGVPRRRALRRPADLASALRKLGDAARRSRATCARAAARASPISARAR